jgi:hypothetical protein
LKKIELKPVVHKDISLKAIKPKTLIKAPSPLGSLTPKPDADQKKKEILPIKKIEPTSLSHIKIIKHTPPPLDKFVSQNVSKPIIKHAVHITPKPIVVKPALATPEPIKE